MSKYLTSQGDMWDLISFKVYNSEKFIHLLIEANPVFREVVVFPANCELLVPEVVEEKAVGFPPWRS